MHSEEKSKSRWFVLSSDSLAVSEFSNWVMRPNCGANVTFTGSTRDASEGRDGVSKLDYEAYEDNVFTYFTQIAQEIEAAWPMVGAVCLAHRVGEVAVGGVSVVVAVSSPHRPVAFEAASFGIDRLKEIVPIWKKETWPGGSAWVKHC